MAFLAAAPAAISLGAKALAALGGWAGIGAGVAGSFLPGIIDALASSKTPQEAAAILAPARDAKIAELIGGGMRRDEATAKVDEEMKGEIQAKMQEGSLPAWAELGLGLVSGVGAAKLVGKLGKLGKKAPDAPVSTTPPGTNMGKLGKESVPGTKLAPGLLRPYSPTAGQRGFGAKSDGLIEELDKAPTVSALERRPGSPSLERKPFKQDRGQEDVTRRRGNPLDDGSDMIEQRMPERGLTSPFGGSPAGPTRRRSRESEADRATSDTAPIPMGNDQRHPSAPQPRAKRRYELDEAQDAEFETIQRGSGQPLISPAPEGELPEGLTNPFRLLRPRRMDTDVSEDRLRENIAHSRRFPKAPPRAGTMSDINLPLDEERYLADLLRDNPQGY